jgi:HEAT repeat protein
MIAQYKTFRQLQKLPLAADPVPTLPIPAPDVPRVAATRTRVSRPKAPSLESLIEGMRSTDPEIRGKAVRTFVGKLKGRPQSDRRPDLIQPLCDLFYSSPDRAVRSVCVQGLTEFAEADNPPKPLFDALSDAEPGVVLSGTWALHHFPDPRAWKPLCDFIASRKNPLFSSSAISPLGRMREARAVPTLARELLDPDRSFPQNLGTAAQALAECGPRGVDALIEASRHVDASVRLAAAIGLDLSGDGTAAARLDELKHDPDPQVSERAKKRHGKPFWM